MTAYNEELNAARLLNCTLASKYAREVVSRVVAEIDTARSAAESRHLVEDSTINLRKTLRSLNPERVLRRAIRKRFSKAHSISNSTCPIEISEYFRLTIQGLDIRFGTGTLVDQRGVGRVARHLLEELIKKQILEVPNIEVGDAKPIYFYPSVHWCPPTLPPRSVVMVHDVIPLLFEEIFRPSTIHEWKSRYINVIKDADVIVTVSQSSAADISRCTGASRDKIHVVYNGVSSSEWESDASFEFPLQNRDYFVCLGSNDYHKNIDVVVKAMAFNETSNYILVVIGDSPKRFSNELKYAKMGKVFYTGRVTDGQLARILKGSRGLLFPSLYEGFGLPPLEALMLQVPCVCSSRPAMTEILADMVTFADPHIPQEWAIAMQRLASSDYQSVSRQSVARTLQSRYNWENSVNSLLSVFHKLSD